MDFKASIKTAGAAALLSGLLIAPAFAASADSGNMSGTLQKTHDMWRASDIKGANVYNSSGQQIGSVNGLLLTSTGSAADAIISVGGYIGVGNKLVEVPFSKLKFEPSQNGNSGNTQANNNGNNQENYSIVCPNATSQSLKDMASFKYNSQAS